MLSLFPVTFKRQRGAALILALVVFAIVALLATSLSLDFFVSVRRVENQLHSQQAMAYMRGAEGIVRKQLAEDYSDNRDKDHRSDDKLRLGQEIEMPLDHGVINGVLCDLQGRFNINNLAGGAVTPGAPPVLTDDQERFIRLLQVVPMEPPLSVDQAREIAEAVIDWVDSDSVVTGLGGAELSYYDQLDPPYRPANRPVASISELRWVKGVSAELYAALSPYITALDPGVEININTAPVEVLRSIRETGNLLPLGSEVDFIVGDRDGSDSAPNDGFDTMAEFKGSYATHTALVPVTSNLSVRSDYFMLDTRLLFLDREHRQLALLKRDSNSGKSKVIARAASGLSGCR